MKKLAVLGMGAVFLLSMPIVVSATVLEGSFSGRADHSGGTPGVYVAAESYTAYQILNTTQQNPWYPWNGAFEYTLRITTSVTSYTTGATETVNFADATVEIWEDAGTTANFAATGTFTDGTLVLSGTISNMVGQRVNAFGFPYGVTGDLVLDGGTGLGNVDPQCNGNMVINDFINFQIPFGGWPDAQGYEEAYDSKFDCKDA
ncbi:MAG TPA: hypothetical protein VKU85_02460, partial [bacterium]|nr:hypothetical protein [bacterium]